MRPVGRIVFVAVLGDLGIDAHVAPDDEPGRARAPARRAA